MIFIYSGLDQHPNAPPNLRPGLCIHSPLRVFYRNSRQEAADKIRQSLYSLSAVVSAADALRLGECGIRSGVFKREQADDSQAQYYSIPPFNASGPMIVCSPSGEHQRAGCTVWLNIRYGKENNNSGFSQKAVNVQITGITSSDSSAIRVVDYRWRLEPWVEDADPTVRLDYGSKVQVHSSLPELESVLWRLISVVRVGLASVFTTMAGGSRQRRLI